MNQNIPRDNPGPLCLTAEELRELTGRTRAGAQRRVLNALGIDVRGVRPDGKLVVLRSAVEMPQADRRRAASAAAPDYKALSRVS